MAGTAYLRENEQKAVQELKERLTRKFGPLDMLLFGSKARGLDRPGSDIDILITLPERTVSIESEIDDIVFEVNLENDALISTVMFGREELEKGPMAESPIYRAAQKEGIPL